MSQSCIQSVIGTARPSILLRTFYGEIKVENLDCVGHVQKRMGKHLLNQKAKTKGKLADG